MSDDEDTKQHTFRRGNDSRHYLDSVPILTQASSNSTTAPSDGKLVARAISGCAPGEREIMMRWKQQLTPAELLAMETVTVTDNTDPTNPVVTAHVEPGKVTYPEFRRIFISYFPLVCVSTAVNKFLKMKQDKPLEYWIPEYDLAAQKSGIALNYGLNYTDLTPTSSRR